MKTRLLLVALLLAAAAAWAGPPDWAQRSPVEQARHEVAILNLVNNLDLNADQRRSLAGQAAKARELRAQCRAREQALEPEAHAAYTALKAELLKGRRADPAVERRAQEAKHPLDDLHDECTQRLTALAEETKDLLSPGQQDIVRNYAPCLAPPKNLRDPSRVGQANDGSVAELGLERIRSLPPAKRSVGEQRFVERHLERYRKLKPTASTAEVGAEGARVRALIQRACAVSDADFALNRAQIGDEIERPFTAAKTAQQQRKSWANVERFLLDDASADLLKKSSQANAQ